MSQQQTFWEHLDELRGSLIKMIAAVLVCSIVAFVFKQPLFDVVLAPQSDDFVTYRVFEQVSKSVLPDAVAQDNAFSVQLINRRLIWVTTCV